MKNKILGGSFFVAAMVSLLGARGLSPQYREYLGNIATITSAIQLYGALEKKLPATYEALTQSAYFAVDPKNMTNPYTGAPMKLSPDPSLGDFDYRVTPEGLKLELYYRTGDEGEVQTSELEYLTRDIQRWGTMGDTDMKTFDPVKEVAKLTGKDRAAYFNCAQLTEAVYRSTLDASPKSEVSNWDTLIQNKQIFNWKIRNPYTGGISKAVDAPSPGDFTYRMYYFGGEFTPVFLCYDAAGKPLSKAVAELMKRLKGHEFPPPKKAAGASPPAALKTAATS